MLVEPVNATSPGSVPDSPCTVGPRVELPPTPPTELVEVEELPPELDVDVGGGVVDVGGGVVDVGGGVVDVGGGVVDDEVGLGQLVRSVAASSEK